MKDRGKDDMEDFEIPKEIINDLVNDEEILYKLKTISSPKFEQHFKYFIYGMIIFVVIQVVFNIIRTSGRCLNSGIFWAIYFVVLPSVFLLFLFGEKKITLPMENYLVITNKRIFPYMKEHSRRRFESQEFYDSIELASVNFITYRNKKLTKKSETKGTIDIVVEDRISIKNVPNIEMNIKIIESIIWLYGNVQEKLNKFNKKKQINLPYNFKINEELWETLHNSKKKNILIFIISLAALIFGIIGFIYTIISPENLGVIDIGFIFLLSFGFAFVILPSSRLYKLRSNLAPNKDILLQLNENKIMLTTIKIPNEIYFDADFYLNFSNMINFMSKSGEYIGAIHIKPNFNSKSYIKFGPIEDYLEMAEIIFLYGLKSKAEQKILENKEAIINYQKISQKKLITPIDQEVILKKSTEKRKEEIEYSTGTLLLIAACILTTLLFGFVFLYYLVLRLRFNLINPVIIATFLITVFGIYNKKKYGFILAIVVSSILTVIYIINLGFMEIFFLGIVLVLAILEFKNYKKNYQQPIKPKIAKVCPNCGETATGNFCIYCGYELDLMKKIIYIDHSDVILQPFLKYLNPEEKVLFTFKPQIKLNKTILLIIGGFFCLVILILIMSFIIRISMALLMIIIIPIMLGIGFSMILICMLPGKLAMKRSLFVFTNQKILAKYDKDYLITPYINIVSISSMHRKTYDEIEILLKNAIESSPFMNKFGIYIPHVPKDSDLLEKIKYIRKQATSSKKNSLGDASS
ncbi:MAG: hypothetical protein ACFFDN_15300 [Candidatus Hodarchaeota archaeon]